MDHQSLKWLHSSQSLNNRLIRWSLALQPYKFVIVHCKGVAKANADAMSLSLDKRRGEGCERSGQPTSSYTVLQLEKHYLSIFIITM